jgi:hypothetical protein
MDLEDLHSPPFPPKRRMAAPSAIFFPADPQNLFSSSAGQFSIWRTRRGSIFHPAPPLAPCVRRRKAKSGWPQLSVRDTWISLLSSPIQPPPSHSLAIYPRSSRQTHRHHVHRTVAMPPKNSSSQESTTVPTPSRR